MSDEAAFLNALKANPADDTTRLVYADWLDEHDQPERAEYLRLTHARLVEPDGLIPDEASCARILELGLQFSDEWRAEAAGRFDLVVHTYTDMVNMIKAVRELNGTGLGEMKYFVYNLPQRVFGWLPLDTALAARMHLLQSNLGADIQIPASELGTTPHPGLFQIRASYWLSHVNTQFDPPTQQRAAGSFAAFLEAAKEPADTTDLSGTLPALVSAPLRPTTLIRRLRELRRLAKLHESTDWLFLIRAQPLP